MSYLSYYWAQRRSVLCPSSLLCSSRSTLPPSLLFSHHAFPCGSHISFSSLPPFSTLHLMCLLCHMDMILSLFHSLALVGSTAFSRPCRHLLLLSYPYALPLLPSHPYLLFLSPLGSFVSSRCHPSSSSISVVRQCWERERGTEQEKKRGEKERESMCVC